MSGANMRRLRKHWAKNIRDRPLALQLLKVRPFIYTACRLQQVADNVVEQAEEPLAILSATGSDDSLRTIRIYDGILWISSTFSSYCRPDFKCSYRIRFRGQCFWLVRLLDYEVKYSHDKVEFNIVINLLSVVKEFHLKDAIFTNVPNVRCALPKSRHDIRSGCPMPPPELARELCPPGLPCIPGVFAMSQTDSNNKKSVITHSDRGNVEHPQCLQGPVILTNAENADSDEISVPTDFSFPSEFSEWVDSVPVSKGVTNSDCNENVNIDQLDASSNVVGNVQSNLQNELTPGQCELSKCFYSVRSKDTADGSLCEAISTPEKQPLSSDSNKVSSTAGTISRAVSFIVSSVNRVCEVISHVTMRHDVVNQKPLDQPVEPTKDQLSAECGNGSANASFVPEVVLRCICHRLRRPFPHSSSHKATPSRLSLCTALLDSIAHHHASSDDDIVSSLIPDFIADASCGSPEIRSAPAHITTKRTRRSSTTGMDLFRKVAGEMAAVNMITLSPHSDEKLRDVERTVISCACI